MRVTFVTMKSVPFDTYAAWRPVECISAREQFNYTRTDVETFDAGWLWSRNIYIHTAVMGGIEDQCHYEY
jgi:hypothetical protein